MGVMFDYFSAPSDDVAAGALDHGPRPRPRSSPAATSPRRRGWFGRRKNDHEPRLLDDDEGGFDTLPVKGIDPVVQLGTLEELLTGRPYLQVIEDPRSGHAVAQSDDGGRAVLTVTDTLVAALVQADRTRLSDVALPWSQTEEFWGAADPAPLTAFLVELAALVRRGQARGHRLYCWVCL